MDASRDASRKDIALVAGGALLGAAVVLLLVPNTRQTVWHALEGWVRDALGPELWDRDGIEMEAAAPEGGLAATRDWQKAVASEG